MAAVKEKVKAFVESGQLGLFAHGYWGHPAMKLSPEVNLLATAHYFQAIDLQRKANQVVAMLGGKTPHIQNLAVGGVVNAINLDSLATMNMDRLYLMKALFDEVDPVRPRRLLRRRLRGGRVLRRLVRARRGHRQLPRGPRPAHATPRPSRSTCPAGRSSAASSRR